MASKSQLLTTGEFASQAGIPSAKVSKLIRDGKIKAEKKSGKWMISSGELKTVKELSGKAKAAAPKKKTTKAAPKKPAPAKKAEPAKKKPSAGKAIPLADFVNMTYLTENGVKEWLKLGRLTGQQNESGEWTIDAANLEAADVKRLVR